jgi:excisionase family DNA binding protein
MNVAYTVEEVAKLLKIPPKSVYRLLDRGLLKSSSALRHKRIPRSEIDRFLKTME